MNNRIITTATWGLGPALFVVCCGQAPTATRTAAPARNTGKILSERIAPPAGYTRPEPPPGSFEAYLRTLPLKPEGAQVHLFDGSLKHWQGAQAAVIDMSVGDKDLQQCADAVMRLRAEYLFEQERKTEISFHFTSGFYAHFSRWMGGERIRVDGNKCTWTSTGKRGATHEDLMKFMNVVFTYAGTRSLGKDVLESVPWAAQPADLLRPSRPANKLPDEVPVWRTPIMAGDVFVQSGSPGHAVMVLDVARNTAGEQIFLLAQSYMPAQEIHILKNLEDAALSPWFKLNDGDELVTPEWTFRWAQRKRWP